MSNLCSEITLPTGPDHQGRVAHRGVLPHLVRTPYDVRRVEARIRALHPRSSRSFIDNVLEDFIQRAPESFWRATYSAFRERSVGIGLMGLHTYVQSARASPTARRMTVISHQNRILKHLRLGLDKASRELAVRAWPVPRRRRRRASWSGFTNKMAIAPTASISTICGGSSPCCEPIPANAFVHKTLDGNGPDPQSANSRQAAREQGP